MPFTPDRQSQIPEEAEKHPRGDSLRGLTRKGGYDPAFFDRMAHIENKHFWFRTRNRVIFELTRRAALSLARCDLVLEVGCGTGNVLRALKKACPQSMVVGMELWFDGLRHARGRANARLIQADLRNWPLGRQVDVVGMFDVLEHIQDDRTVLSSLWNCIVPGGCLLLTVPAHQFLWSYFDEAALHCRRYSTGELRQKLTEAGFQVEFLSQFMACIFPLVWTVRKMRGLRQQKDPAVTRAKTNDEFRLVPVFNQILTVLLNFEAGWLARGHRLPWGTSLVVVARKRSEVPKSA
jgi:SAM-dependent methyltransferase